MEILSKTSSDAQRGRGPATRAVIPDNHSSYKDYPVHRPTPVHHPPGARPRHCLSSPPSKAIPETSSEAILSALRNLQEKIRRLELDKRQAELDLRAMRRDVAGTHLLSDKVTQTPPSDPTGSGPGPEGRAGCNQVLIAHLAAAESRCSRLERQLDVMRRLLATQVSKETARTSEGPRRVAPEPAESEKVRRLEQDYRRLTRTQSYNEMKIRQLEVKLQEEEHQRKLVQDKTSQLQSGLEANRILLRSVSPHLHRKRGKEKPRPANPFPEPSCTEPHYRLSLRDVPFVAGTSAGCSHSVRANVQSVLSLLKRHQPHLCNRRVLAADGGGLPTGGRERSDATGGGGEGDLTELLRALQEEMRLMSLEQDELMRQQEASASEEERREVQREQERLLVKMEHKGEQISKLYKHVTQMKKLRKEASPRLNASRAARGRCAGAVADKPGERSKRNLELLRDMKALQMSLHT